MFILCINQARFSTHTLSTKSVYRLSEVRVSLISSVLLETHLKGRPYDITIPEPLAKRSEILEVSVLLEDLKQLRQS